MAFTQSSRRCFSCRGVPGVPCQRCALFRGAAAESLRGDACWFVLCSLLVSIHLVTHALAPIQVARSEHHPDLTGSAKPGLQEKKPGGPSKADLGFGVPDLH